MKKSILVIGMFVFAAFASQAQQKPAAAPTKPTPMPVKPAPAPAPAKPVGSVSKDTAEFKFDVMEYNFGTINQGDAINYDFNFNNTGKDPLVISEAHGSCGCTVPQWPKEPIKKGDKGVIKVTFNSTGKSGMQDKTVTITSNAKNSPHVLHLKGTVNVPAKKDTTAIPAATPKTPAAPMDKK